VAGISKIKINLVGRKFGKLTVLQELGYNQILCRCDCGTEKTFNKHNVRSGKSTSCGSCVRKHQRPEIQKKIIGKRFGKLVVIKEFGYGKVECRCDCGKTKVINKGHLMAGSIVSCGCMQKDRPAHAKEKYLINSTNVSIIRSSKPTKRSKTGIRGVSWDERKQKYRAALCCQGIRYDLGIFDTLTEAVHARKGAEAKYFKPILDEFSKGR